MTTDEAVEQITEHNGVAGPVYDIADIFEDDQYEERDSIMHITDPDVGKIATTSPIPKFSWTPGKVNHLAPNHGEHNKEILIEELGLTKQQYEKLREKGITGTERN